MDGLSPSSSSVLADAMRFREARGAVLAGNLANADTPGYRRRDLTFVDALEAAATELAGSNPSHLGTAADENPVQRHKLEVGPPGQRVDGNGVNLDEEAIAFHRNAGAFTNQARILARIEALTKAAISGR
ncbi:MAG: flagellar basal body rod protein FlgB [Myxococcota bacterium]|jgi:flagellar basal-body rod protein FlgB|nr:flagellar basal body rod protein FlgB [Myxococcota bacterium]